jgi:hypothetical protein
MHAVTAWALLFQYHIRYTFTPATLYLTRAFPPVNSKSETKTFSKKSKIIKKFFPKKINQTKKMGDDPNSLRPNIIDLIVLPNKLDCLTVANITTPAL